MDANQIAQQFVQHYYTTFDSNRSALSSLYQAESTLTYEGQTVQGQEQVMAKLQALPTCRHQTSTMDIQRTQSGILIYVTGAISVEGSGNPMPFSEVFQLLSNPNQAGGFWLLNQIFRLALLG